MARRPTRDRRTRSQGASTRRHGTPGRCAQALPRLYRPAAGAGLGGLCCEPVDEPFCLVRCLVISEVGEHSDSRPFLVIKRLLFVTGNRHDSKLLTSPVPPLDDSAHHSPCSTFSTSSIALGLQQYTSAPGHSRSVFSQRVCAEDSWPFSDFSSQKMIRGGFTSTQSGKPASDRLLSKVW